MLKSEGLNRAALVLAHDGKFHLLLFAMEHVITDYLSHLNIPVSKKYFKKCVLSHPDYPSLLSIADSLERLGINHQIGKIQRENLGEVSFPYILQLDKGGGRLLFVKDEQDLDTHKQDLDDWNGVVLKAEPTETVADEEHNKRYSKEKLQRKLSIALGTALLGLILLVSLAAGISWLHLLLLVTSIGGGVVGYLLLAKDLGITYKPVETFCNAGKRTNCDRILNAEDATLLGTFNFTDATASYFIFQLITVGLFVPLFADKASVLWVLATAGLVTIPVIGYSLYYQYVKAQTWCRLCVIVDAILGLQALLFVNMYFEQFFALTDIQIWSIAVSLFLFTVIASSVFLLKSRLKKTNESSRAETTAKRVKHDPKVFTHVLFQEEKSDLTPFEPEMQIGNPTAPVQIMMVINLYCHPCKKAYKKVQQLVKTYPNKVCFGIRILNSERNMVNGLPASTYLINYWRQHIYKTEDESIYTQKLIGDWYENINPDAFEKLYPDGELSEENRLAEKHYNWITENSITRTPTFFINGHAMPGNYTINDLTAMLPGLAELFTEQQKSKHKKLV